MIFFHSLESLEYHNIYPYMDIPLNYNKYLLTASFEPLKHTYLKYEVPPTHPTAGDVKTTFFLYFVPCLYEILDKFLA